MRVCVVHPPPPHTHQPPTSFWRTPSSSGSEQRHASRCGCSPSERSTATLCCVGLVFCSPTTPMMGTSETCTMHMLFAPTLFCFCLVCWVVVCGLIVVCGGAQHTTQQNKFKQNTALKQTNKTNKKPIQRRTGTGTGAAPRQRATTRCRRPCRRAR